METPKSKLTASRLSTIAGLRRCVAIVVLGGGVLAGCADRGASAAQSEERTSPRAKDVPEVLATIGDERVTMADVSSRIGDALEKLETQYRQARHAMIDTTLQAMVRERILGAEARKQSKTIDQLIDAEAGTGPITEQEISAWFQGNQARLGGRSLEQLRPQIADYLIRVRRGQAADRLEARLSTEQKVIVNFEPFRVALNNDGAPSLGPADAPVTLVEFSDFDCPFCGRFHPTLKQLSDKFGDKLRVVYRQYPIVSLHPNAFKAAEASLCAHDQGKFWEMHDTMFQEQGRLSVSELKVKAGRLGLNQKKFDTCLDTGRYTEQVQNDIKEAQKAGVTGTPALFVNGVSVEGGAVSLEVVAKAIDEELARAKR